MRRSCLFLILIAIMSGCSSTTQMKLVGLVQSSKTDESDNPTEIFLWDGKAAYPIDPNPSQEQLLEKVDSKIEAEAEVTESYSGKKTILINKYRILKDAAE